MRTTIAATATLVTTASILLAACSGSTTPAASDHPTETPRAAATQSVSAPPSAVAVRAFPIASFSCDAMPSEPMPDLTEYRRVHGITELRVCAWHPEWKRKKPFRPYSVSTTDPRFAPAIAALAAGDVVSDGKTLYACSNVHYSPVIARTASGAYLLHTPSGPCGELPDVAQALATVSPTP